MSATGTCRHCGLPYPVATDNAGPGFCCFGCSIAFEIGRAAAGHRTGTLSPVHVRIALAVLFAMAVMMFSLISYSDFVAWEEGKDAVANAFSQLFSYLAFLCTLPVMVLLGRPMLRRLRDARQGHSVWLEILVLVGISAAFVLSAVNLIRGSGHTYFETVVFTMLLWSVGRYVEALVRTRTMTTVRDAIGSGKGTADRVRLDADGESVIPIPYADLQAGDVIRMYAGDMVAVDGRIRRGRAFVDESVTSGEFLPVTRSVGDVLTAGATIIDATIDLELTADPKAGSLARLGAEVSRAVTRRGRISRAADRASRILVFLTLALGLGTFSYWFANGGLEDALINALSVYLVACPCSLGIAVPLVVFFGLQEARRLGVLFRSGEALERAAGIDRLLLDKTGTLTAARPRFVSVHHRADSPVDADTLWCAVVAIERQSRHPLGRAIVTSEAAQTAMPVALESCRTVPGAGMIADVMGLGGIVRIGTQRWFESEGITIPKELIAHAAEAASRAHPASLVSIGESVVAVLEFGEDTEAVTLETLERLAEYKPAIVTGAQVVDDAFALWPVHRGIDPEGKRALVEKMQQGRMRVAMAGDGLNDAIALAAADLGIAVRGAQDVNRAVADVQLLRPGPGGLPILFAVARLARRRIRQNIGWSIAYNALGLFLAVTGRLHPLAAAVAMFGSSMLVLWNSRRWYTGKD